MIITGLLVAILGLFISLCLATGRWVSMFILMIVAFNLIKGATP